MIISHKYKYLFIETRQTGSTAIASELCENYYGKRILKKHSSYFDFIKHYGKNDKYFIFTGIRNPLDKIASTYMKYLSDHKKKFSRGHSKHSFLWMYNKVQRKRSFFLFLKMNNPYPIPYIDDININRFFCDYIYRFETLQNDFKNILKKIGFEQKRPLPLINPTKSKKNYLNYYNNFKIKRYAIKTFGPFMKEWGYHFPQLWSKIRIGFLAKILYKVIIMIQYILLRYTLLKNDRNINLIRDLLNKLYNIKYFSKV